jgi:hypothetical protein
MVGVPLVTTMSFGKPDSMPALTRYDGVDSRPTLLRVLTDLYVQKPAHSVEEEHHYTELALRLVEVVDLATRKTIAERLVRYPAAPLAVIQRLARDIFEFAKLELGHVPTDPQLRDAPRLAPVPPPRREPARQPVLDAANTIPPTDSPVAPVPGTLTARLFAEHTPAEPTVAPVEAEAASAPVPPPPRPLATNVNGSIARATPLSPPERQLGEQFYALDVPARRLMLLRLAAASERPPATIKPMGDVCTRLEAAALGGQPDVFIGELEGSLAIARTEAQRIVNDTSGEPVVVAAKALAMPLDVLQRILLFLNPAVGRSVERLYALSALYEELRPDAALRLVAAWRSATAPPAKTARHQPQLFDDERRSARDNAAPAPRRMLATPTLATDRPLSPYSVGGRHRTI